MVTERKYNGFLPASISYFTCFTYTEPLLTKPLKLMKNSSILLLAAFLLLLGCNRKTELNLSQDPIIQKIFTPIEIESLTKVLTLYQNKILTEYPGEKDFIEAYRQYLNHHSQFGTVIEAYSEANINKELYEEIYDEMIESGLFSSFYISDSVFLHQSEETKLKYFVRRDGKYAQLLSALAENDSIYDVHVKSLQIVGDFPPSIIANLFHNHEEYNLTDLKVQLLYIFTLLKPLG